MPNVRTEDAIQLLDETLEVLKKSNEHHVDPATPTWLWAIQVRDAVDDVLAHWHTRKGPDVTATYQAIVRLIGLATGESRLSHEEIHEDINHVVGEQLCHSTLTVDGLLQHAASAESSSAGRGTRGWATRLAALAAIMLTSLLVP